MQYINQFEVQKNFAFPIKALHKKCWFCYVKGVMLHLAKVFGGLHFNVPCIPIEPPSLKYIWFLDIKVQKKVSCEFKKKNPFHNWVLK